MHMSSTSSPDSSFRNFLKDFYQPITMPGGWTFNHVERLKSNNLIWNSQFKTGDKDSQGFKKFFINKVQAPCAVSSKFIDLDVKDALRMSAINGTSDFKVWVMQRRLKQWMRDGHVGALINELTIELPKGHVVIKKTKDGWKRLNIENIRTDTTSQYLKLSPVVADVNRMFKSEIDEMGWDTSELYSRQSDGFYDIYDTYTKIGKSKWKREIKASMFCTSSDGKYKHGTEANINDNSEYLPSIVLFTEEVSKFPYRELKWEDIPGRWLGRGIIEDLSDEQIAYNEAYNLERKGLIYGSLKLFWSRSEMIGGSNVLTGATNGDILTDELQQVAMEERNLASYNAAETRTLNSVKEKTFFYDASRGENLPSRTPLGVANTQVAMIASYFDLKRENFGFFLRDWIIEDVMPDFKNDSWREHVLTFLDTDDDIDEFRQMVADTLVGDIQVKYALETGFFPSKEQVADAKTRIINDLRTKKNAYLKIMNGWYEDVNYKLDIDPTGEQLDIAATSQIVQLVMQAFATNPAVFENPVTRSGYLSLMRMGGISPVDLKLFKKSMETAAPAGTPSNLEQAGSMSAPVAPTLQTVTR